MATTLHVSSNWGRDLVPDLRKYIVDGYKQLPDYVGRVFRINSIDRAFVEDRTAFGLGQIVDSSEGATTPEANFQDGYTTRYTPTVYKTKVPVTKELYDDDQYNIFMKRAMELGKSARRTENKQAFSAFSNAFSTSYTSYGDASPLCSTSHSRADGGTAQSNASSTSIPLTSTNLETGLVALRQQLDDRGELIDIAAGGVLLLVPTALEKEAIQITKSDREAQTADNDMNYYRGRVDVLTCPWIGSEAGGSDTAWFLLAKQQHQLNFMWRQRPTITNWQDEDTDVLYTKLYMRFDYGWSDWRGVWGSQGTGAAYSS